MLKSIMARLAD